MNKLIHLIGVSAIVLGMQSLPVNADWYEDLQKSMRELEELGESFEREEEKEQAARNAVINADINAVSYKGTAKGLIDEFKRNSIVAEDKYMHKAVEISGTIGSIDDSIFSDDEVSIAVKGDEYGFQSLTCIKPRKSPVIYKLANGDRTVVRGIVSGESVGIELSRCHFWSFTDKKWMF